MNVQPGQWFGFIDPRQAELQWQAMRNRENSATLQQIAALGQAHNPPIYGLQNVYRDPYYHSWYEKRYGIPYVFEDTQ